MKLFLAFIVLCAGPSAMAKETSGKRKVASADFVGKCLEQAQRLANFSYSESNGYGFTPVYIAVPKPVTEPGGDATLVYKYGFSSNPASMKADASLQSYTLTYSYFAKQDSCQLIKFDISQ